MRILVIGSGAREHALLLALSKDESVNELHVAPGGDGMSDLAVCHPEWQGAAIDVEDGAQITALAQALEADLVVVGPEIPLVAGVGDALREAGIAVFGPSKAAAMIEGSKAFAKDVMQAAGVATATATRIESADHIESVLDNYGPHYVIKDDGLAGGKGVVVTTHRAEAEAHARSVIAAGNPVLVESFLDGPEVSLFCFVDGETVVPLLPAQDHKRAFDHDEGPNTGGMGAYAPLPWLPEDATERIVREVCEPVAREMVARDCPYSGLLYAGLAWGADGPAVVEFNCRFGDPETQAVLALLKTPLAEVLAATAEGRLAQLPPLQWHEGAAVTVVLAAEGYPAVPRRGDVIHGLGAVDYRGESYVLHAGTKRNDSGEFEAAGGRVLNAVARGSDIEQARAKAYELIESLELAGGHYRSDIAAKAQQGEISI
ncbi:Phosphoribosylamine--glycine ligase [Corynebacterium ciconiae DSM 44920]|uniref:phosphoribosylamine--glycine ligase n=1 Tax=Corynebacterium ciconiae TaxID=227319 RepID=UPI0003753A8F|nr:phosphoribosylamine--glycine ligase [Corynebacterium ciconiae]WKD60500.1 Phosphoribosylamine--glycine ligase [Corynebacterium ciconiae DSM 44920]